MAVLDLANRKSATSAFVQEVMQQQESITVTKADLLAAITALDAYFDANAAAINAAIPLPARTNLSTKQKARAARFVLLQRYLVAV